MQIEGFVFFGMGSQRNWKADFKLQGKLGAIAFSVLFSNR